MIKATLKQIRKNIGIFILKSPFLIGLINYLYENGSHQLRDFFVRQIKPAGPPKSNFYWFLYLSNGSKLEVPVTAGDLKTWQFAQSYKWNEIGIRKIEEFLNDNLPMNEIFCDIGANLGLRSLYSLSIDRKTFLFEPNVSLRYFTEVLFEQNDLTNYRIENVCLGNEEGNILFYISESSYLSSIVQEYAQIDGVVEKVQIPITKLDSYQANYIPNQKIGLIKIDVEGYEKEVLLGAENVLSKHQPCIIVEIQDNNKEELFDFLENYINLYEVFLIKDSYPYSYKINDSTKTLPKVGNYLFLPRNKLINFIFKKKFFSTFYDS